MTRAAAVAVAAALALTGCRGDAPREPKVVVETRFLDRLSAAITDVNATRRRLADDGNALGAAAQALDEVDAAAVQGERGTVRSLRPAATRAAQTAGTVARRIKNDVAAYERAVGALAAADTPGLTPEQAGALARAVTAARAELAEAKRYAAAVTSVWTRYEELDANQKLWLARASNGWYRDQQESAGAYVVLTDRTRINAARQTFATADATRVAAARSATAAFDAARAALASLLS